MGVSGCDHRVAAPGRATLSLEAEALFVVGALRAWVAARRPDPGDTPPWREIFALADLPEAAAAAFDAFLSAVGRGMRRGLDIRCGRCPRVGRDEEALLALLAALQAGDRLTAILWLEDWLAPPAVMPTLALAQRLAAALQAQQVALAEAVAPGTAGLAPHRAGAGAVLH